MFDDLDEVESRKQAFYGTEEEYEARQIFEQEKRKSMKNENRKQRHNTFKKLKAFLIRGMSYDMSEKGMGGFTN